MAEETEDLSALKNNFNETIGRIKHRERGQHGVRPLNLGEHEAMEKMAEGIKWAQEKFYGFVESECANERIERWNWPPEMVKGFQILAA